MIENFSNQDERFFPEANRPRDEHGFPLRPGQQLNKWDMRGMLKNIYLESMQYRGASASLSVEKKSDVVVSAYKELKTINGKGFCMMDALNNSNGSRIENGKITFLKGGSYMVSCKMKYQGRSSSGMGAMFTLGKVGGRKDSLEHILIKTVTPGSSYGVWNFWSSVGIGNIEKGEALYAYFTGGDMIGFNYEDFEIILDIIKLRIFNQKAPLA